MPNQLSPFGKRVARLLAGLGFLATMTAAAQSAAADFHTIVPCRLIDTRQAAGPLGGPALTTGPARVFAVVGKCQIPLSAAAISVNVTVVAPATAGYLQIFASGTPVPDTSTVNYAAAQTRANQATVALGTDGALVASLHQATGTSDLVVDVTGYFGATSCSAAQTPASPLLQVNTGTRLLSWPEVRGATSYDAYVRAEPGQCGLMDPILVTRADQKVAGVASPYDVSGFNKCGTCYWVDVVSVSGDCRSPLQSDLGLAAPLGFSLLPCIP